MIGAAILPDWRKKRRRRSLPLGNCLSICNAGKHHQSLQDWCGQIIEEEKVHTLMMSGLAHRNGQQSAVVQFPEPNRVSMKEMAIHNALTGCIGETWSAVELCHQAEHAPKYNGVFKRLPRMKHLTPSLVGHYTIG